MMKDNPTENKKGKFDRYALLALVWGLAFVIIGIYGTVGSRIAGKEYKNATDIREVSATIESYKDNEHDEDNDSNYIEYDAKLSYEVDGKKYKGRETFVVNKYDYKRKYYYDTLKPGDTVTIEVYRTSKGKYKMPPDSNPFTFLMCSGCLVFGCIVIIAGIKGEFNKKPDEVENNTGKKGKKNKKD